MSSLVWECAEAVNQLGRNNSVIVKWVLGHTGMNGNETADYLAKAGSQAHFKGR